jgi:hypothetical protein
MTISLIHGEKICEIINGVGKRCRYNGYRLDRRI